MLADVLRRRRTLRSHDRWSRAVAVAGWLVIEADGALRVLLASPARPIVPADVVARVTAQLARAGANGIGATVEVVDEIPRTALGKASLVRRLT
jgi:hypothetical protein